MIIEIIDSEEKIQSFLPVLDKVITGGLVTMEKIRALQRTKSALAHDVLGEENFGGSLTLQDLQFLFADDPK